VIAFTSIRRVFESVKDGIHGLNAEVEPFSNHSRGSSAFAHRHHFVLLLASRIFAAGTSDNSPRLLDCDFDNSIRKRSFCVVPQFLRARTDRALCVAGHPAETKDFTGRPVQFPQQGVVRGLVKQLGLRFWNEFVFHPQPSYGMRPIGRMAQKYQMALQENQ